MRLAAVLGAMAVAAGAWVVLFRRERDDIWPRTWAVAAVLIAYSAIALATVDRLDTVLGPVGWSELGVGALAGLAWLVATHVGFAVGCRLFPSFLDGVQDLYQLGADQTAARVAGPILAMAVAEELLFRGVIQGIAGFAVAVAVYTAVQLVEGTGALVLAGLLGAVVWGGLVSLTGGLVAPIVAHAIWTLTLTVAWPLGGCEPTAGQPASSPVRSEVHPRPRGRHG